MSRHKLNNEKYKRLDALLSGGHNGMNDENNSDSSNNKNNGLSTKQTGKDQGNLPESHTTSAALDKDQTRNTNKDSSEAGQQKASPQREKDNEGGSGPGPKKASAASGKSKKERPSGIRSNRRANRTTSSVAAQRKPLDDKQDKKSDTSPEAGKRSRANGSRDKDNGAVVSKYQAAADDQSFDDDGEATAKRESIAISNGSAAKKKAAPAASTTPEQAEPAPTAATIADSASSETSAGTATDAAAEDARAINPVAEDAGAINRRMGKPDPYEPASESSKEEHDAKSASSTASDSPKEEQDARVSETAQEADQQRMSRGAGAINPRMRGMPEAIKRQIAGGAGAINRRIAGDAEPIKNFTDQDRHRHPFTAFRTSSERSEGSLQEAHQILRSAQDDRLDAQDDELAHSPVGRIPEPDEPAKEPDNSAVAGVAQESDGAAVSEIPAASEKSDIEKGDIADAPTTAFEKSDIEKGDIADAPTTAFSPVAEEPAPEAGMPDIADAPTTAFSPVASESSSPSELASVEPSGASKSATAVEDPASEQASGTDETIAEPAAPLIGAPVALGVLPAPGISQPGWDQTAIRRTRLNRILIRKRRIERSNHILTSRLATVAIVVLILVGSLTSGGLGAAYSYYNSQLPLLNGMATHSLFQTTHIYDRNGNLLYSLYDKQVGKGRRTYVNYSDIPAVLVNATIAAEDHSFWTNDGVDFYGILRAAISNLQNQGIVSGASTVTEQLIKNQFFPDNNRNFEVKAEEAILAAGLTQQYPKWKIMEMYLNTVYYGDINYGVEAAAQDYFGLKEQCTRVQCTPAVTHLDLAQASLLAGLPQSPTYYNPIINKSVALNRQQYVLQSMVQLGMITPEQAKQAHQEMANFHFKSYSSNTVMQAPHFVSYLIDQVLIPLVGAQNLVDGGYNIYTTLDLKLEKYVEQSVYNHLYKPQQDSYLGAYGPLNVTNNVNNGAVVVMNPKNGEILAMDGSANYNGNTPQMQGQDNAAISLRQPGSSFKPIVYATAFEMGWYPGMIVPDHKTIYPADPPNYYSPQNYDGTFHTSFPMTIRTAVANSYNIPAIDTIMFAGIPNVLNMAARLGLNEVADKPIQDLGPSLAIGATEVSLLHMTDAYATFANNGMRVPPVSILQITDNQGRTIYNYDEAHPSGIRAMRPDVAYLISSMLSDTKARYHEFFPGNPLELDRPAAAKTGTTDSFRDNWTMGYTPYLTVGVWAGNSDNSIMNNIIGITGAGPIWHDVMEYASHLYKLPPTDFAKPADVHQGSVSAQTGLMPHPGESTVSDWFIDGTEPTITGGYYYSPTPSKPQRCHGESCQQPQPECRHNKCQPVGGPIGQPIGQPVGG